MSARRVGAIVRRILQQFARDRRTLALLFVVPIVILGSFYFLLRGGGEKPQAGVVVQDSSPLAAAVAARLRDSPLVDVRSMDEQLAVSELDASHIAGYVVLGPGFGAQALQDRLVQPSVHLEGSEPGPVQTVVQAVTEATASALSSLDTGNAAPRLRLDVHYRYGGPQLDTLDYFGAAFIGLVVFFLVYVITSVSFLRERSQGTLERLFASPVRRGEIVLGYMLGFSLVALAQAVVVLCFALYALHIHNSGNVLLVFLVELLLVLTAVNLGIFLSSFARTEFQAVQFIPLVIVPQVLLSGVIVPVASEPRWMQGLSRALPLTYAVDGLRDVMIKGAGLTSGSLLLDAGVVLAFGAALVVAATATLRRRIA